MKNDNTERQEDPIAQSVMDAISRGKVKMKPRRYFIMINVALVAASVAAGVIASYFFALLFWWVRLESAAGPAFGIRRRLDELVASFPWWALILAVIMIGVVVWLTRKFGSLYRYKIESIVVVVVIFALLLGAIFSFSGFAKPDRGGQRQGLQVNKQILLK